MLPDRELSVVSRSLRINRKSKVLRRRELWKKIARERENGNKQETMGNTRGRLYAVTFYPQAVDIGVGTFALVPARATVGEDKALPVERPVFRPCRFLKKFYKLKCAKTKIPDETPFVQLDFEQIAAEIHFRREIVERCIHETLLFFAGALQDDKEVEFSFKGIGILAVRRKVVSMTFVDDCLLELDGTGNMPAALLGDSKMMRTVAFAGKNDFSRLSRDEVITLPSADKAASPLSMCPERVRGGRVCGGSKEGACGDHQLSGVKAGEAPAEAAGDGLHLRPLTNRRPLRFL
ncbi:uncharacterized protein [Haliaeetus albicilla]|uniref:uncharacterized protein n=1 Tax=Haliaeetus albicilla TaxID=8969 RepID=UPI0037E83DDE